ncbi:serine/threonine protein phosphatase [Thermosphaera chiliense]|uniref:Serine/threonine protein phosphatase n=1 Tax=Thermosphaera chiliense TaxID=3402707 RepID=A0A7M1UPU6_9CREN|nr:metallophosphoesterase family protein [Thermosphaera aggregans]QOR94298.1 serine/threonine protein phosphatase [Thermosphaera aggregans]
MNRLDEILRDVLDKASDPRKIIELMRNASGRVKSSTRNYVFHEPGIIEVERGVNLHIIGDLHGDIHSLLTILGERFELLGQGSDVMVFLGDYVDRGDYQIETLALLLYLKTAFNDQIILLRGNHEPPTWLIPHPHDFPSVLVERYGEEGEKVYSEALSLFNTLPITAYLPGEILMLHGGPPLKVLEASSFEEAFSLNTGKASPEMLEEILWSDPVELNVEFLDSPRGAGVLYGKKVSSKALGLIHGKYIVRSHEMVNGYRVAHDGLVITVFDAAIPYGLDSIGVVEYLYDTVRDQYRLNLVKKSPKT